MPVPFLALEVVDAAWHGCFMMLQPYTYAKERRTVQIGTFGQGPSARAHMREMGGEGFQKETPHKNPMSMSAPYSTTSSSHSNKVLMLLEGRQEGIGRWV